MLIAFIHIFSFMYSSLISISLLWQIKIRLCVNVCKKEALILLISFISLREKISTVCKSSLYEKLILSDHSAIGQLYYCSCGTQMLLEDNVWGLEPASPKFQTQTLNLDQNHAEWRRSVHNSDICHTEIIIPCPYSCQNFTTGNWLWVFWKNNIYTRHQFLF